MPEFDKDVFELMIEKVIIGEKEQENQQSSYEVSKNYLQPMCEPRGVCGVDGSKKRKSK